MNPRTLLGSVITIALALPTSVHSQGAVESALTQALSSSTTVKAGSALNHPLNQTATQLGIRIQERTSGPVRVGAPEHIRGAPRIAIESATSGNAARAAVLSGSSPVLGGISVQGGEAVCNSVSLSNPASPAAPVPAPTVPAKSSPATAPASVDCHRNNSGIGDKYKSFVTLPLPK